VDTSATGARTGQNEGAINMAVLSSKKKKPAKPAPAAPKRVAPKRVVYEPSHFVWLKKPRQPALVLYGEKNGVIVVFVTPVETGDTGRREVTYDAIEGRILP